MKISKRSLVLALVTIGILATPYSSDAAKIWGVYGSALYVIDVDAMTVSQPTPVVNIPDLYAVAVIDPGRVYVANGSGDLYLYEEGVGTSFIGTMEDKFSSFITPTALGGGRDGALYLGRGSKTYVVDPSTAIASLLGVGTTYIGDIAANGSGQLFALAGGNLTNLSKVDGSHVAIAAASGLGLAFTLDGRLFMTDYFSTNLIERNPLTGASLGVVFNTGVPFLDLASELGCGNSLIDPMETCDDGNAASGDGCDSTCQTENCFACVGEPSVCTAQPDGTSCDDDNACTDNDMCTALVCTGTSFLEPTCRQTTKPGKSKLILKDKSPDKRDKLIWKWVSGEQTDVADLGSPETTTDYTLCVTDAGPALNQPLQSNIMPAGGTCKAGRPCWKAIGNPPGTKGYKYVDALFDPAGMKVLRAKPGSNGRAKMIVKGKGVNLDLALLPLAPTVNVQLKNSDGECWGASFATVRKNDTTQYKAKSD